MPVNLSNPVSRRLFMQASAGLAAALAAYRASPAFAEGASLNILNSNTAWANALSSIEEISSTVDASVFESTDIVHPLSQVSSV